MGAKVMDREELVAFLKENLTINIKRTQDYYSYPELTVSIEIDGEQISAASAIVYDEERHGN